MDKRRRATQDAAGAAPTHCSAWAIFLIFLRLGLSSFGGPIAHLGYFRTEFVEKRRWLSEHAYADLVALCQFLPGPASSQVGMALGFSRGGYAGALAAWLGFTLPSAIALILFALGLARHAELLPAGALHGLKVVAVAVVAQAVWGMARTLCTDVLRVSIMAIAACAALALPSAWGQVGIILVAGFVGLLWFAPPPPGVCRTLGVDSENAPQRGQFLPDSQPHSGAMGQEAGKKWAAAAHSQPTIPKSDRLLGHMGLSIAMGRRAGAAWLALFCVLLLGLPALAAAWPSQPLRMVDAFYRAGALVFGGGHVVLPLLQAEVVPPGWVSQEAFLAGYGAAQAVPGPLFTFAAFLGASMNVAPSGWWGGLLCLAAIFAPSFLLILGALPFWELLRHDGRARKALFGINAAVVGLLLAALYTPVWTSAILAPQDFGLALLALVALMFWRLPPWLVVLGSGLLGSLLGAFGA